MEKLKADLEKAKKQLKYAEKDDEKAFAQKKIDRIEKEIAEAEKVKPASKSPETKEPAPKKTASPKKQKKAKTANAPKEKEVSKEKKLLAAEELTNYAADGTKATERTLKILGLNTERASELFHNGVLKEAWINECIDDDGKIIEKKAIGLINDIIKYFKENKQKSEPKEKEQPKAIKVDPKEKEQQVGKAHILRKHDDDIYYLVHKKKNHAEMEFQKNSKGKWTVTCLTKEKKEFDTLQQAVEYAASKIYRDELKEYVGKEKAQAKKRKERIAKRTAAGKPAELTPTEVAAKATKTVIEKIETKDDEGKSVTKDVNGALRHFVNGVRDLKAYKKDIDKKLVRQLIAILQGFIK